MARAKRVAVKRKRRVSAKDIHVARAPSSQSLLHGVDNGTPIVVDPAPYIPSGREQGWGPYLDNFLARNRTALQALSLDPNVVAGRAAMRLEPRPGHRAGAIHSLPAVTNSLAGGGVVTPRFGWAGIGRVLSATGWGSGPEFLSLPLVPGSGREVPPWVLAGPVLRRLSELLAHLRPGYRDRSEVRTHPRGQIQWPTYIANQFATGRWHHLPCRFSELDTDSRLRQAIRWTLERLRGDLSTTGGRDLIALSLIDLIVHLLERVIDVAARRPSRRELDCDLGGGPMASTALREGLRAISWIVDERGLGGGRSSDGLAWALPLDDLWERYVEHIVCDEAIHTGGRVRVGRKGETTIPLSWNTPSHRSLGHLVPDFVIQRADSVEIVDAKYKAHFADLDTTRWREFTDEAKESLRADVHQVLAYAAVVGMSSRMKTTLMYPVKQELFDELQLRNQDRIVAQIPVHAFELQLQMRAVPFGRIT